MLRMLNLKDQKANKNYLSICPLKQNKESLAVFKLDSVVLFFLLFVISVVSSQACQFNPHTSTRSRTFRKPHNMHTVACTSASPCDGTPQGMCMGCIPFPASHHIFCGST